MNTKSFFAGLVVSMAVMGSAMAEDLATMDGIPVEAMSHEDMGKVEGKAACKSILGCSGAGYSVLNGQPLRQVTVSRNSTPNVQVNNYFSPNTQNSRYPFLPVQTPASYGRDANIVWALSLIGATQSRGVCWATGCW